MKPQRIPTDLAPIDQEKKKKKKSINKDIIKINKLMNYI